MTPLQHSRAVGLLVSLGALASAFLAAQLVVTALGGASPLLSAAAADFAATLVVFLFSWAVNNTSVYDPYWSVAPPVIGLYWLLSAGGTAGAREVVVLGLAIAWSLRLTANWVARWRGIEHEDWRYAAWRGRREYWAVSLGGFHLMPTVVVFLGCLPLYPVLAGPNSGLRALEAVAAVVTAGAVLLEAVADTQLARHIRSGRGGVLDRGLWAVTRHPNYAGEVLFWWGLWLFALAASPSWWWTVVGPVAMSALFLLVSVPLMDRRLASRYPGYTRRLRDRAAARQES